MTNQECFEYFLQCAGKSNKTIHNYSSCLAGMVTSIINRDIEEISNLYDITDPEKLNELLDSVLKVNEFAEQDRKGGNMYSAAFNMYINYIRFIQKPFKSESDKINEVTDSHQIIYYGAPGTGKSHKVKERLENVSKENIFRTTFHPDSDYATFVGSYKPTRGKKNLYGLSGSETICFVDKQTKSPIEEETITYKFIPQAFLQAYTRAYQTEGNVYLVIEEINRGNCAQIFGDLFQLLDRDKNGKSEYTINADSDLGAHLIDKLGKEKLSELGLIKQSDENEPIVELCLPSNLYIFATMNTSDQSLFPIDSAFKRRWDWEYEPIKYKNIDWKIDIDGTMYSWVKFQKEVNTRILKDTGSEDKMMGDYFVNPHTNIISKQLFLNKVLFYLWNDVCKDGDADIFPSDKDFSFSKLYDNDNTLVIKGMMEKLGVEPEVGSQQDEEEEEDKEGAQHKRFVSVTLNGIKHAVKTTKFDLYLEIIKEIGIDKVGPVVENSKYKRLGCPLISKEQFEEILNSKDYHYVPVEDYYVVKGMTDDTKVSILNLIKDQLNLDMEIETGN